MSILTPIFGFIKSQTGDNIGITIGEDLPANWDKVEEEINANREQINSLDAERKKYAKFRISANQSIPHSTNTQIAWSIKTPYNGEDFCEIDATTNQVKILKDGMYEINFGVAYAALPTGTQTGARTIWSGNLATFIPVDGNVTYTYISNFIYCTAGTLLNLRVHQTQGTAVDIIPSGTSCSIRKVV